MEIKLTYNKRTALRILRAIRCKKARSLDSFPRTNLLPPDRGNRKRWTKKLFDLSRFGLSVDDLNRHPLDIAVGLPGHRIRMKGAHNTVCANNAGLPPYSFIYVGGGIAISCPELIFAEMAEFMTPVERLMLGHELCGSYSRDPDDPYNKDVTFNIAPVTSAEKIRAFCSRAFWLRDPFKPSDPLDLLADNAWSPTESLIAALLSSPYTEFGYNMGPCVLNKRLDTPSSLSWTTDKSSRVPDILLAGTNVGINYDGAVHLDLDSVIDAAINLERHPEQSAASAQLDAVMRNVRAQAIDDIHRNRELVANGYIVFPVVKEDLYQDGALDYVIAQIIEAVENYAHRDMSQQRRMIKTPLARARRQELIWSLMPGKESQRASSLASHSPKPLRQISNFMIGF